MGQSQVRKSVRYITYDSCATSVVPPFDKRLLLSFTISLILLDFLSYVAQQLYHK